MYTILWHYTINPQHRQAFLEHYHSEGIWAKLFLQSPYYFGTDFFEVAENEFITVDKWSDPLTYEKFLADHQQQYREIDCKCEGFTVEENLIGNHFLLEF